jgi:hypothetical protein
VCEESGCADAQICTLNGTQLVCMAPGTQKLNLGCNDETLCAQGLCVIADGENIGKCRLLCVEDSDCEDPDYACLVTYSYANGTVGACDIKPPACNVFEQDCGAGMGCYLDGCLEAGEGAKGSECSAPNECKPGLLCVSSKCNEICNPKTGGPDPKCHLKCPGTQASIQGEDDVGICSEGEDKVPCDLLLQDCEKAYEACYFSYDGPGCDSNGSNALGSSCEQDNDCVPGTVCYASQCMRICKPSVGGQGPHLECDDEFAKCSKLPGTSAGYCDE